MSETVRSLLLVAVVAAVTIALRFLPFAVFRRRTPAAVAYLGEVLPYAIMAMLVVYCLKGVSFVSAPHGIPEAVAVAAVVVLHKWRHNTLLSIIGGTLLYMLLVQWVF